MTSVELVSFGIGSFTICAICIGFIIKKYCNKLRNRNISKSNEPTCITETIWYINACNVVKEQMYHNANHMYEHAYIRELLIEIENKGETK